MGRVARLETYDGSGDRSLSPKSRLIRRRQRRVRLLGSSVNCALSALACQATRSVVRWHRSRSSQTKRRAITALRWVAADLAKQRLDAGRIASHDNALRGFPKMHPASHQKCSARTSAVGSYSGTRCSALHHDAVTFPEH